MEAYTLEPTDLKILKLLQQDWPTTDKQLYRATHKSPNPIVERVHRLNRMDYIKRTAAIADVQKIKNVFTTFPLIQLIARPSMGYRSAIFTITLVPLVSKN